MSYRLGPLACFGMFKLTSVRVIDRFMTGFRGRSSPVLFFFSSSTHLFYDPINGVARIIDFFLSTFYKLKALVHLNFTVSGSIL